MTALPTPDLQRRFDYHSPTPERVKQHERVRGQLKATAMILDAILPAGREKATAFTNLEQAMFWANAAIARHEDKESV